MLDYLPVHHAASRDRPTTIGARIAEEIMTTFAEAVEFYGTQCQANGIRRSGTAWLRSNDTGLRLTVQRAAPMDHVRGRAGLWEATVTHDANRPTKHTEDAA